MIPARYTCDGRNVSPPLVWENAPEGTVAFALAMEDPDAPMGTFIHWLVSDIPGGQTFLPEGSAGRGVEGNNSFNKPGYGGPCPPPGKPHRYYFKLYALDETTDLAPGFNKFALRAAMEGHILGQARLMGLYGRGGS